MFERGLEKTLIVVAPDKYKTVARQLTHELSKLDRCNATYWTIKHFEGNEVNIDSRHWIVSIGNAKENSLTADYLNFIELIHDEGGICYGMDGQKAIVFGNDNKMDEKITRTTALNLGLISSAGFSTGAVSSVIWRNGMFLGPLSFALPYYFRQYLYKRKMLEEFLKITTSLSADLFLQEGVHCWLDIHKEGGK